MWRLNLRLVSRYGKKEYRYLCDHESTISLFSRAWWLDAVAGIDNWDVVVAFRGDREVGTLPFIQKKRFGVKLIAQPQLTQALGPWVCLSKAKYTKSLADEKDILACLLDGLPEFDFYNQHWHWSRQNWLPFYWRGFRQTTRYSYILSNINETDRIWDGCQKDIRGNIRKAIDRFGVCVRESDDIDELLPILRKTFDRQHKRFPLSRELLQRVDSAAASRGQRAILLGEDADGVVHAGTYIVWDGDTAYQILNGYDPEFKQSGAGSLCVWRAIEKAAKHVNVYDFEGSMLEPVERFFRAFGAKQIPYFHVTKAATRKAKFVECCREIRRIIS